MRLKVLLPMSMAQVGGAACAEPAIVRTISESDNTRGTTGMASFLPQGDDRVHARRA